MLSIRKSVAGRLFTHLATHAPELPIQSTTGIEKWGEVTDGEPRLPYQQRGKNPLFVILTKKIDCSVQVQQERESFKLKAIMLALEKALLVSNDQVAETLLVQKFN